MWHYKSGSSKKQCTKRRPSPVPDGNCTTAHTPRRELHYCAYIHCAAPGNGLKYKCPGRTAPRRFYTGCDMDLLSYSSVISFFFMARSLFFYCKNYPQGAPRSHPGSCLRVFLICPPGGHGLLVRRLFSVCQESMICWFFVRQAVTACWSAVFFPSVRRV